MIEINKIILINSISIPCTVFELRKQRTTTAFVETKKLLTITFIENYETLFSNRSYITFLYFKQRISREFYRILDWKTKKKGNHREYRITEKEEGREILKLKHRVESSLRLLRQRNFLDDAYRSLCTSIEISSTEEEPGAVGPTMRTAIPHRSEFTTRHYALSHRTNGWQITVDTRRNDLQPTHIYETWLKGTRPFSRQRERKRERERRERGEPLRRSNAMLFLSLSLEGKNRLGRGVSFHRNEEYWKILFVMYNYRRVRNHLEITGWSLDFFCQLRFRDTKCTGFLVLG